MNNKKIKTTLIVGLIKGRHELPVEKYIFNNAIENVHNYEEIEREINRFLVEEVGVRTTYGCGINQIDYTDVQCFKGKLNLVVYVTGLTCVTAALIKCCALNGIKLTLMHYDSTNGNYVSQKIF